MELRVFHRPRVFLDLSAQWRILLQEAEQASVFLAPEWFASWWAAFGQSKELEVFSFWQGSRLRGVVPFYRRGSKLLFLASPEVTDYGDVIVSPGWEEVVGRCFLDYLRKEDYRIREVQFFNVPADSSLRKVWPALLNSQRERLLSRPAATILKLSLPEEERLYESSLKRKVRHELRRKRRRLLALEQVEIVEITSPEESLVVLDDFIRFHCQRHFRKASFWAKPGMKKFFRILFKKMASSGWLVILGVKYQPGFVAYLIQFDFQDKIYLYNVAFNKSFARYSPGIVLFDEAVRRAIKRGKREVDFLRGDEKYKLEFGVLTHRVYNVSLVLGEK